jgi:hypothetical protein
MGMVILTKYYPVTKEELYQIKNDCEYPETNACDGCEHVDEELGCSFKGANILIDEVMERANPMEVLKKWMESCDGGYYEKGKDEFNAINKFIKEIHTDPDSVIARGKEEGWLK